MTNNSMQTKNLKPGHWEYKEQNFTCPKCGVFYPKAFHGKQFSDKWERNLTMFTNKCCANYFLIDGTVVTYQVEKKQGIL